MQTQAFCTRSEIFNIVLDKQVIGMYIFHNLYFTKGKEKKGKQGLEFSARKSGATLLMKSYLKVKVCMRKFLIPI